MTAAEPSNIVILHAAADARWLERLRIHLKPLERSGRIRAWDETSLLGGAARADEVRRAIASAGAAILLLSADFFASDLVQRVQLPELLARDGVRLIPLIVSPCLVERHAQLAGIQPMNGRSRPLIGLPLVEQEELLCKLAGELSSGAIDASATAESAASLSSNEPPRRTSATGVPQLPGTQFDGEWYVTRRREEESAAAFLAVPGKPVILSSPRLFGKSWLLERILARCTGNWRVARVNLLPFSSDVVATYEGFLRELARRLLRELGLDKKSVAGIWGDEGESLNSRLESTIEHLLRAADTNLVLAIDNADAIVDQSYRDDFFRLLRGCMENVQPPWPRLRLILASSTTPLRLTADVQNSTFQNLSTPIELEGFSVSELEALGARYGLPWGRSDMYDLMHLVGGHPALARAVMYECAANGSSLTNLLTAPMDMAYVAQHRRDLLRWLRQHPELHLALRSVGVDGTDRLAEEQYEALRRAGLVVKTSGRYSLRCALDRQLL